MKRFDGPLLKAIASDLEKSRRVLQTPRRAAVLIPLVNVAERPAIVFTLRSTKLRSHSGQVSFPGGRIDPEDVDAIAAALRETHEEIGWEKERIEVLGVHHDCYSKDGDAVTPVVAYAGEFSSEADVKNTCRLNPSEVSAVFCIPIADLNNSSLVEEQVLNAPNGTKFRGKRYTARSDVGVLWGLSAVITEQLLKVLVPILSKD